MHLAHICTVTYSRKPRAGKRVKKFVTNIPYSYNERSDITVGTRLGTVLIVTLSKSETYKETGYSTRTPKGASQESKFTLSLP